MIGILQAKMLIFLRKPWTFIGMTAMSVAFAFIFGLSSPNSVKLPVYTMDANIEKSIIGDVLNETEIFDVQWLSKAEVEERVSSGKAGAGIALDVDGFELLVAMKTPDTAAIYRTVESAYLKKAQYEKIIEVAGGNSAEELKTAIDKPSFLIKTMNVKGKDAFIYDNQKSALFGFTLFFVIYTIAYQVFDVLVEKKSGIWDRLILSPVKKWEIYLANLFYSFMMGYIQVIVVFLVFKFGVGVDFKGRFIESLLFAGPYVFAVVALSILITACVKTVQQFNAIIPIIAVSSAMIGGAYWPIEMVESKVLLLLAKFVPLTYGMEILSKVTIYEASISELLYPVSILLLMGVAMIGIGIHLMENRHV